MIKTHDDWYKKLFSNPKVVEDLLVSFVKESFIKRLDFSTLKRLNSSFISKEFKNRESDIIYEIKSRGKSTYIYLLIEFQSTVDPMMALRMANYVFQFYQELSDSKMVDFLQPVFPILLYNGDKPWNAPEEFSKLLRETDIPDEYIPKFRYYKIAINEIPKRNLVKIRNAVSAVFYVENSTPEQIEKNHHELIDLLKGVFYKEGALVVDSIVKWIESVQKIKFTNKSIEKIQDLMEIETMWETAVREHEAKILEQGVEKGIEKGIEKGKLLNLQSTLIDLSTIKFGSSTTFDKKVKSTKNTAKLESAIRKILTAKSRNEIAKFLE